MKKMFSNKYVRFSFILTGGIFLGWLFFHSPDKIEEKHETADEDVKDVIWTCAMHPQIRMHEPGKCPICGMDLIPLNQNNSTIDPAAIRLSKDAAQLANVLTSVVSRQKAIKEVRLYGKVQADERMLQSQVSYLPGHIEKLFVNYTGETVRKGQKLAVIYSPDLITAQQELLETAKTKSSQPIIYEAAKDKLRQWKLTDNQIAGIESSGIAKSDFEVSANTTGIVMARRVNNGDYISPGTVLFDVADLSHIWVMFDAYESDLPFLSQGDHITFTVQAMPGVNFTDNISFIDPVLDPITRVAKVRVEINNQAGKLKPEMFATGIVEANLNQYKNNLIIPGTSVLWTGKRSVVYVKQTGTDEPVFKMREIEVGPMLGNSYVVMSGLNEGEEIVTQGAFSVDAAAQLEGKPSMMNRQGGQTSAMPGMEMPGKTGKTPDQALQHAAFGVSGNCDMCKERIEKAATSVQGVKSADWDKETKMIAVSYDSTKTDVDIMQIAIAKVGHDTGMHRADDKVYDALPACCHYDRPPSKEPEKNHKTHNH